MYAFKFAAAIKARHQVLREFEDAVYLPFGSEYKIYLKNKNSVRASVKVEIDGVDVTEGVSLVIGPNEEFELERFIKNGNLTRGNKFKFIERTAAVERHRGTKVEDGLVRIEFQFEKPQEFKPYFRAYDPWADQKDFGRLYSKGIARGVSACASSDSGYTLTNQSWGTGITAPGAPSDQEFKTIPTFELEGQKHTIIFRLLGEHQGKYVSNSVTTRMRAACVSCGALSKTNANFCSNCGTSLQIID
jgi:hypothetical protein